MKKKKIPLAFSSYFKVLLMWKILAKHEKGGNITGLTLTLNSYTNSLHIILSMSAVMNVNWQGYITTP